MKKLCSLAIILLAACNSPSPNTATHEAVSNFMRDNANDPASYKVVRWGKPVDWRQKDADALAAKEVREMIDIEMRYLREASDQQIREIRLGTPKAQMKPFEDRVKELLVKTRKLAKEDSLLRASVDTTRLGKLIMHAYRGKNKLGALVLDSAQFLVLKNGEVKVL